MNMQIKFKKSLNTKDTHLPWRAVPGKDTKFLKVFLRDLRVLCVKKEAFL